MSSNRLEVGIHPCKMDGWMGEWMDEWMDC
jgi:hypothetical protein